MANHCYIIPTKNQEQFYNPQEVLRLLKEEFSDPKKYKVPLQFDLKSDIQDDYDVLFVRNKFWQIDYMFCFFFYNPCPFDIVDDMKVRDSVIDKLDKIDNNIADRFIWYTEHDMDLSKCIEMRHSGHHQEEWMILKWMCLYFGALIVDDGIFPDIIMPETLKKEDDKRKSFIKKFGEWLSK
jgi:hypothetical protein